ncbi:MAG: hypothetical protein R3C10_12400 [Pirellulales bacterium]
MGFYDWIRENTKHAVLLGVSDAIDAMGDAGDGGEMNSQLVAVLNPAVLTTQSRRGSTRAVKNTAGRKRLGRSLSNVTADATAQPAADASAKS